MFHVKHLIIRKRGIKILDCGLKTGDWWRGFEGCFT